MKNRVLPQSLEMEMAVIGCMLLSSESRGHASEYLDKSDFCRSANATIFDVLLYMHRNNKDIDLITVQQELRDRGVLDDVGGLPYLTSCIDKCVAASHYRSYSYYVKRASILRYYMMAGQKISDTAHVFWEDEDKDMEVLSKDIGAIMMDAIKKSREIDSKGRQVTCGLQDVANEVMDDMDAFTSAHATFIGTQTGIFALDKWMDGLQRGEVIIIGARPSVGKSSLAIQIATHVARFGHVLFVSLEMPSKQLFLRVLAQQMRVDMRKIRTGDLSAEEWHKLGQLLPELSRLPMTIDNSSSHNVSTISALARECHIKSPLKLICIDYIQLINSPSTAKFRTRNEELTYISRQLKNLAVELDVPIIVLAQLNRDAARRARPQLFDLRDSGALEADADCVILLHNLEDEKAQEERDVIEAIFAKQRNGPVGSVYMVFHRSWVRFDSLETSSQSLVVSKSQTGWAKK